MVDPISLHLIDSDTSHSPDFIFSIPKPVHGKYLVMLFRSRARISTAAGMCAANPGDFIIHSPDFPLWHTSADSASEGFRNDWFYVLPEAIEPLLLRLEIPLNTLMPTGQTGILHPIIAEIRDNLLLHDDLTAYAVCGLLERMFIAVLRAHRQWKILNRVLRVSPKRHFPALLRCRNYLRNCPDQPFDIERLAGGCSLSPERFVWLFKSYFSCTPFAELMRARNLLAQKLLTCSDREITEIARECGWRDHHYFDRVFRKENGMSPGEFRKKNRAP